jgi:CheY-like chemotaxis protein
MAPFEIIYVDNDLEDLDFFAEAVINLVEKNDKKIQLTVFKSGKEAIPYILDCSSQNCLIFLDINMPEKNGYEVLKEIRYHKTPDELPVLMYSTAYDQISIGICSDLGANSYVIKPHSLAELKGIITRVVERDWKTFKPLPDNFVLNPLKG